MKKYTGVSLREVEQLIQESGDHDCVYDCVDGTLIDNILFYSVRHDKFVAAMETAINEWSSVYTLYVGDMKEVETKWDDLFIPLF